MKKRQGISRREFLKVGVTATLGSILGGLGVATYAQNIEPAWLQVEYIPIPVADLPPALEGYRLAHISDIHFDNVWMTPARLERVIAQVNQQQAEAILITGDFVTDWHPSQAQALSAHLRALRAPQGVFACLGNHDHRNDPLRVTQVLRQAGIRVLRNEVVPIGSGAARLYLAGLDDTLYGADDLAALLRRLPAQAPAILLAHEPDTADRHAATGRFALQLSGHSHGGQVIPPGGRPLALPPLAHKYPLGLYRVQEMWQYTNRGLGMVEPRVRFNCRPEITILQLIRAA